MKTMMTLGYRVENGDVLYHKLDVYEIIAEYEIKDFSAEDMTDVLIGFCKEDFDDWASEEFEEDVTELVYVKLKNKITLDER